MGAGMTMTLVPAKRIHVPSRASILTPEVMASQAGEYPLRTWRFSWDKDERTFHLRDEGLNLFVRSITGYTEIEGTDPVSGRMYLTHALVLDGDGNAQFLNEAAETAVNAEAPAHQMCFNAREHKWWMWQRPEGLNPINARVLVDSTKKKVNDYRGPLYVFWPRDDQGGHLFTRTPFDVVDGTVIFGGAA